MNFGEVGGMGLGEIGHPLDPPLEDGPETQSSWERVHTNASALVPIKTVTMCVVAVQRLW